MNWRKVIFPVVGVSWIVWIAALTADVPARHYVGTHDCELSAIDHPRPIIGMLGQLSHTSTVYEYVCTNPHIYVPVLYWPAAGKTR
jgi:hypothetical protein